MKIVLLHVKLLIKAEIYKRHSVIIFTANVLDTHRYNVCTNDWYVKHEVGEICVISAQIKKLCIYYLDLCLFFYPSVNAGVKKNNDPRKK